MLPDQELHSSDCPMTNSDAASQTVCTCDALENIGVGGPRDTPVGGLPHGEHPYDYGYEVN